MLTLYTQPRCGYCDIMKSMLDNLGKTYYTIDISESPEGLAYMKKNGHKTVPQLYYKETGCQEIHINKKDTTDITSEDLLHAINEAEEISKWPYEDSGVEQVI